VTSQDTSGRRLQLLPAPSSCIRIDILPGKVIDATTISNMGRPRAMISSLLFALFAPYRRCSSIRSGSSGLSVSSNNGPVGGTNEEYWIRCIWCCSGSWLPSDRRLPPRWMNAEIQDTRPPQGRKAGREVLLHLCLSPQYCTANMEVIWFKKEIMPFGRILRWYPLYGDNSSFSNPPRTRSHKSDIS
jgi:hypothetical protein